MMCLVNVKMAQTTVTRNSWLHITVCVLEYITVQI